MEWINVKDRLPKDDSQDWLVLFIGWDDIEFARVLEYDVKNNEWYDYNGLEYDTVTMWQPIPKNKLA